MDTVEARKQGVDFSFDRILELIPHRYPILMIDKMTDVVADQRATGIKNVTANENFFEGHFPDHKVMPGVLIIEAMAQTAAALVVHTLGSASEGSLVYFMSIDSARFRKPVVPGDTIHVHVEKQRSRANVWKFTGKAVVDGTLVADATFAAMILDKE
jgi:3-hydroxyacyl-[acyl-carrier-protein] dehydratase